MPALVAVLLAAALLFGPYLLIRWAAVGSIRAIDLAVAPPLSIALLAWIGLGLSLADVPFSPLWVTLGLVTPAVLLWAVRIRLRRRDPSARLEPGWQRPQSTEVVSLAVACGLAISMWASSQRWVSGIPQYWDGIWHGYLVGTIMRRGLASPFELTPLDPFLDRPTDVYPYGFHLVAALVGEHCAAAAGITSTQIAGAVLVATVVTLAATREVYRRHRVALLVAPAASVLISWWQVRNAGIPSYNLGMAMVPGVFAAILYARRTGWSHGRTILAGVAIAALWLVQPATVFSLFVVLVPYALARLWHRPAGERRISWRRIRPVIQLGLVAALVVLPWLLAITAKVSATLDTARIQTMGLLESALRALLLSDPEQTTNWVISVGVVLALVLAVAGRLPRWLAGAWLFAALLYVVAAGAESQQLRQALTGVWFTDWYRLGNILAFVGALLLAGLVALSVSRARGNARPATIAVLCVAGLGAAVQAIPVIRDQTVELTAPVLVTSTELDAGHWVAEHAQPGERVLNQWSDGSPWGYAQYGTPVAVPYSTALWRMPDRAYAIEHLGELGSNPRLDKSMLALRIRWVIVDPTKLLKTSAVAPKVPVGSPFARVAFQSGQTTVYRIELEALARAKPGR